MKTGHQKSVLNRLRNSPIATLKLALPNPRRSLRGKISFFVCAVTLLTALLVTFISTQSVRGFLYAQVEHELPALLQRAAEKVDLLYQQRLHEVGVFAGAHTLVDSVARFNADPTDTNLGEIRQFLSYVYENSPQFESLLVLSANGEQITGVGKTLNLGHAARQRLSAINKASLDNLFVLGRGNVQIVSVPILSFGNQGQDTLHAVINLESLQEHLQNWELSAEGAMYLVDAEKRYIATNRKSSISGNFRGTYRHAIPQSASIPALHEYKNSIGQDVVGSAIYIERINGALIVEEPNRSVFAPVQGILWRTLSINLAIVFIVSLVAYRITRSISRPISALSQGVNRLSAGERSVAIPEPASNDEIGMLTQAFNSMTNQLDANTRELERLSVTDGLTQLYNYRYFQESLSREVDSSADSNHCLALILCDIDHFKQWNDRYGHAAGDKILCQIAGTLKANSRDNDLVARYGGDEFVVLAPRTDLAGALILAEKFRSAVAAADVLGADDNQVQSVTISTGVSIFSGSREALFEEADRALYSAKHSGRDCVRAAGVLG